MNILYLTKWDIDESSGVYKKIMSQQAALKRLGHECHVLFVGISETAYLKKNIETNQRINLTKKSAQELVGGYDCCYVRFELFRHKYYQMVFYACSKKKVPIILEIPTYPPYEESIARAKNKLKNHNYFGALKTYLGVLVVKSNLHKQIRMSHLVCNNGDGTVFKKTKTIRIENGIDFDSNPYINRKRSNDIINIIAVSNFSVWNGYDLAIQGLYNYRKKTGKSNVYITFVGDTKKASDLIALSEKCCLEDCVEFTGLLSGDELNAAYAKADVALGGLADHRRKAFTNSSLKAKEYAARGLVMILSESEGIETEIKENSFIVEAKEKPVDFELFLEWYKNRNVEKISETIHTFALDNYSWDIQMEFVISEFKKVIDKNGKSDH